MNIQQHKSIRNSYQKHNNSNNNSTDNLSVPQQRLTIMGGKMIKAGVQQDEKRALQR
jgi:hypothetical protein